MLKTPFLFICLLGLIQAIPHIIRAQNLQLTVFDVDTARLEWTAMALSQDAGMLAISSVQNAHLQLWPYNENVGDIRLRLHFFNPDNGPSAPVSLSLTGKARVYDMHWGIGSQGQQLLFIAGAFADSLRIGSQQLLINPQIHHYDAFVIAVNRQGQVVWHWHRHDPGNQRIIRIRPNSTQSSLIITGQANDSTAWTGLMNAGSGGLIWEKNYPGIGRLSDALFEGNNWIKLCGTSSSTAQFEGNNMPAAVPSTGIVSFLARVNPFNDSAEVLSSRAYDRLDFAPRLLNNSSGLQEWLAPGVTADSSRYRIIERLNYPVPNTDSLFHESGFFMFEDAALHSGVGAATHFLYQAPNAAAMEYHLQPVTETKANALRMRVTAGTGRQFLGNSHQAGFVLMACRSTGGMEVFNSDYTDTSRADIPGLDLSNSRWAVFMLREATNTHTAEQHLRQMRLYPNPVREGKLYVGMGEHLSRGFQWELLDLQGRLQGAGHWQPGEAYVPLPETASGMYLIRLHANGHQEVRKLLLMP